MKPYQLDSRLLCNAMGHPGWPKKYPLQHSRNALLSYFTQFPPPPPAISQWNITTSETIYTCAEEYLEEAFSKIPVQKMVAS